MLLEAKNIKKTYGKGTASACCALKGVSLSVKEGESVAIIGKSGSGKSTLLHILGLLDDYEDGSLILYGEDAKTLSEKQRAAFRNQKIGFVMQDFALVPDLSVFDNVAVPLYIAGARGSVIEKQVRALLDEVGLSDKIGNRAADLSGGQKQRVALARAMVYSPKLLLADEPTGALDQSTGKEMLRLMLKYQEKGTALVIVTHDPEVAGACGRRIELADGKVSHCEI